jgi:ribosomal protein L11 methyltransferase
MKNLKSLWHLAVRVAAEAEDATGELIGALSGKPATISRDADTQVATVSVYFECPDECPAELRQRLRAGLADLAAYGLEIAPGRISFRAVRREDWAESWKRHFRPMAIGRRLLVKPSWSRREPVRGQSVVVLDPGLSFGTGQHPTTHFCLTQLAAARKPDTRQSFLDIGTGSGILAIAAAKLGYRPVHGFDFDPEAVRVARENAARNRVSEVFRPVRRDLLTMPTPKTARYDLVCANLLADLLVIARDKILAHLRPGGRLVVAGILAREFGEVRRAYQQAGLRLMADRAEKEWCSGCFVRPADDSI